MRGAVEAGVFLGLAAAVHLGVALGVQANRGAAASGAGGAALVSVEAAPESFAALAEDWREAPEAAAAAMPAPAEPVAEERAAAVQAPSRVSEPSAPESPAGQAAEKRLPRPGPPAPPDVATPPALPQEAEAAPVASARIGASVPGDAPGLTPAPRDAAPSAIAPPAPLPPPVEVQQARASDPRPRPRPAQEAEPAVPAAAPAPAAPSAPQPPQAAEGQGGGAAAGVRAENRSATLSDAERHSHMAAWGAAIRARIERAKRYPAGLRAQRTQGTVLLQLQIARDGRLLAAGVARGSGHAALDRAALQAVRGAGRLPGAPSALRDAAYSFQLPVTFVP